MATAQKYNFLITIKISGYRKFRRHLGLFILFLSHPCRTFLSQLRNVSLETVFRKKFQSCFVTSSRLGYGTHDTYTSEKKMNITTTSLNVIDKPFSTLKCHVHNTLLNLNFFLLLNTQRWFLVLTLFFLNCFFLRTNGSSNSKFMFKNSL